MSDIAVSVIIPTYYHEEYVARSIESVLNQKCDFTFELLVADDCSKDDTLKIANQYAEKYPNQVFVHTYEENVGTCKNYYDAIMRCRGKYIVDSSGDDYFCDENKLQKQYNFLEADRKKEYVAVSTVTKTIYSDGQSTGSFSPLKRYWNRDFTIDDFLGGDNYETSGIMFRNIFQEPQPKEQIKNLYLFSKYVEDLTLNLFFYDYGKVFILPDVTFAITARRSSDENQHNYNTICSQKEKAIEHLTLLNRLHAYYGDKYDLRYRYDFEIWRVFSLVKQSKDKSHLQLFQMVPKEYRGRIWAVLWKTIKGKV